MEPVFKNLPSKDYDYIMYQLKQLQIAKGNVSKCDQCKNKMRFVKKLIDENQKSSFDYFDDVQGLCFEYYSIYVLYHW